MRIFQLTRLAQVVASRGKLWQVTDSQELRNPRSSCKLPQQLAFRKLPQLAVRGKLRQVAASCRGPLKQVTASCRKLP